MNEVVLWQPTKIQIPYDYTVEVRNRFKGLDLIDRVPDELWTEVCDIVQETGIKTIPTEKKCKKAKWLSGEALQIAVKRKEAKSKGEKERYKHLNAWSWRYSSDNFLKSFSYSSSVYSFHLFLISSTSVRSIPFLSFIKPIFA